MEDIYKLVGVRVRTERKRLGLTQEELAEKADITANFLGHIERGTKKTSLETIEKLATALEIPVGNLFSEMKYEPKKEDMSLKKLSLLLKDSEPKDKKLILKLVKMLLRK